ncbi:sensor histidine kinase [Croceitalea rosinachiae]|uniref:histidine kinase n=1 Tax=Croceitalea rosinachiae TaxID=3075596 RepID=A0ABU3ABT3_9FLAO|nr:histidine kinase dimerization/phosphoacceptor domain -containing protein [Croceitalea sp. F388]MDT0607365.1 histidine kinase dimerization/phosphoacceptor domain -containing protein [Croceitalea sp. F388]
MLSKVKLFILTFFLSLGFNITYTQTLDSAEVNLLSEFKDAQSAPQKLELFFDMPNRYVQDSAYDWLEVVNVYLNSSEITKDSSAISTYRVMQAQLYKDIGDYDKSIAIAKEIYAKKDSLNKSTTALVLTLLDENYGKLQMYDKQIETREAKKNLGLTEGVAFYDIYANMGLYRQAMKQYILAVKPTISDNDHLALARHHNIVGNYLRLDKSAPTAITEYNKANGFLEVFINDISKQKSEKEIFESEFLKAEIEGNIGKSHVLLKNYIEAIPHLKESIDVLSEYNNGKYKDQIIDNRLYLAEAHLQLDNNRTAKRLLEESYDEMTVQQELKRNRLLAYYYDKIESFKSASTFYKRNERITDSLKANELSILKQQLVAIVGTSDLENSRKLINEQKLANEKIRSEIQAKDERINLVFISLVFTLLGFAGLVYAYLKSIKNQRLIAEQKHFIENSLKEKESLLKEIHHRVKNNLQMVSSLLSLQTRNTKSKAAIVALEEGKSRVKAMALIHQKLYQNDDLSVIEMQGYIESLINSVQSVYKKGGHNISITVDAEATELDIDRAIPFGLILNELVSNSFKYAFPESDENGKIYIHLRKNGEGGYFEYADNGIGLPEDTDERTNSSMGLRLINRLVNQLQSKLNIDKTKEGVRFWFNFK